MELIAKTTNSGKTREALGITAYLEGVTLFVSNEEYSHFLFERMKKEFPDATNTKVFFVNAMDSEEVRKKIYQLYRVGVSFENVILDTSRGITDQNWFKLARDLEDKGMYVVTTQNLVRHASTADGKMPVVPMN